MHSRNKNLPRQKTENYFIIIRRCHLPLNNIDVVIYRVEQKNNILALVKKIVILSLIFIPSTCMCVRDDDNIPDRSHERGRKKVFLSHSPLKYVTTNIKSLSRKMSKREIESFFVYGTCGIVVT